MVVKLGAYTDTVYNVQGAEDGTQKVNIPNKS
jgi:hypothetical protein